MGVVPVSVDFFHPSVCRLLLFFLSSSSTSLSRLNMQMEADERGVPCILYLSIVYAIAYHLPPMDGGAPK
jgi:hypothetical protein